MVVLKCRTCGKDFMVKPYKRELAKYCSYNCRNKDFKSRFKGQGNPFYRKRHSRETKLKLKKSHIGLLTGEKHPLWGQHHSKETRKKISESVKRNPPKYWLGKKRPEEFRRRLSKIMKENPPKPWLGKKRPSFSKEWLENMSRAVKKRHEQKKFGFQEGENNLSWSGGVSYRTHGYGSGWTGYLKTRIKKRDGHSCQICEEYKNLSVHHIDYNKKNCEEKNLITLCRSCNVKVNFNRRKWERLLKKRITDEYSSTL